MKKIYKVKVEGKAYEVELEEVKKVEGSVTGIARSQTDIQAPVSSGNGVSVKAPMPGSVFEIKVNVGDTVTRGQVVAVLEAMKMETEILSETDGKVTSIAVSKGVNVNLDDLIMTIN